MGAGGCGEDAVLKQDTAHFFWRKQIGVRVHGRGLLILHIIGAVAAVFCHQRVPVFRQPYFGAGGAAVVTAAAIDCDHAASLTAGHSQEHMLRGPEGPGGVVRADGRSTVFGG